MNNIFTIEISSNIVAWYGAIIASASLIFAVYNIIRDNARVKVKYSFNNRIVGNPAPYKSDIKYIEIEAINAGRRPIRIDKAYIDFYNEDQKALFRDSFSDHRNKILTEENPRTSFLVEQKEIDVKNMRSVTVVSGTGGEFKKYVSKFPTGMELYYKFRKNHDKK